MLNQHTIDLMNKLSIKRHGITFSDITLADQPSDYRPDQVALDSIITREIRIKGCMISAAMDTVTEDRMAKEMARNGCIGIIHRNASPKEQAEMVRSVKRRGIHYCRVRKPETCRDTDTLSHLQSLIKKYGYTFTSFPILDKNDKFVGLITGDEMDFAGEKNPQIREIMKTGDAVVTAPTSISNKEAFKIMKDNKVKKLPLLNEEGKLDGMYIWKDLQKHLEQSEWYSVDRKGRFLVGAAIGFGEEDIERARLLVAAGCDILVLDSSHGACRAGREQLVRLRGEFENNVQLVIGNIASYASAKYLLEGPEVPDALKIGIGPGTICTTRKVTGTGVPQMTAIYEVHRARMEYFNKTGIYIPVIADGGITCSGDIVKCFAVGADCIMGGSLFAGTDEAPGEVITHNGIKHKTYRGMGSREAMETRAGSRNRYLADEEKDDILTKNQQAKVVPEGVQGIVPYKGGVERVVRELNGGIRGGLAHSGACNIEDFKTKADLWVQTTGGYIEGKPHNLTSYSG